MWFPCSEYHAISEKLRQEQDFAVHRPQTLNHRRFRRNQRAARGQSGRDRHSPLFAARREFLLLQVVGQSEHLVNKTTSDFTRHKNLFVPKN